MGRSRARRRARPAGALPAVSPAAVSAPTQFTDPPSSLEDASAVNEVCEKLLSEAGSALLSANRLPHSEVVSFASALDLDLRAKFAATVSRTVTLAASVATRYAAPSSPFQPDSDSDDGSPVPEAVFEAVVEASDAALDAANAALDEAAGIKDAVVSTAAAEIAQAFLKQGSSSGRRHARSRQCIALDIEKPQLQFPDWPIDNADAPFVPLPPDGAPPVDQSNKDIDAHLRALARSNGSCSMQKEAEAARSAPHPFDEEISEATKRMVSKANADGYNPQEECVLFRPLDPRQLGVIDSEEELFEAAQRLHGVPAIAVDLEHHSVRSFQGFICLVQVSTRTEDMIFDAIALRGSIRRALAPIFSDPSIVKVMHGADHDMKWLERDFGIYVVNMFDTGQAARLLAYSSFSLTFLLKRFADVDVAQKREFQTADWRQRPLPEAMVDYARSDTHYLLYVWDRIRCELHEKGLLEKAWEASAVVSRKRYVKERFDPDQAVRLAAKYGLQYNPRQMRVLSELCRWRDMTAREEDESIPYVMSNRVMFSLVRGCSKAREADKLLNSVLKGATKPSIVVSNAEALANLISDSLDAKLPSLSLPAVDRAGAGESKPFKKDLRVLAMDKSSSPPSATPSQEAQEHAPIVPPRIAEVKVAKRPSFLGFESSSSDEEDENHERDSETARKPSVKPVSSSGETGKEAHVKTNTRDNSPENVSLFELSDDEGQNCNVDEVGEKELSSPLPRAVVSHRCDNVAVASVPTSSLIATRKPQMSLFSAESESESDVGDKSAVAASVLKSFAEDVVKVPDAFVTLEEPSRELRDAVASSRKPSKRKETIESDEEFLSLREKSRLPCPPETKKKTRKGSLAGNAKTTAVLDSLNAYDYASERARRKRLSKGDGSEDVYDPFATFKLKTSASAKRVKRVSKNPKSGERSISFQSR